MNIRIASLLAGQIVVFGILVSAQDTGKTAPPRKDVGLKADAKKTPARKVRREPGLDGQQQNITSRYKKFEKKLLQLAEFLRDNDAERAELLKRAYGQSRDDNISNNLDRITALLSGEQRLGDAVGAQADVVANLQSLLILLQSDDLKDSLKQEQERVKDLLKNLRSVIGKHKRARTGNDRGEAADQVARRQAEALALLFALLAGFRLAFLGCAGLDLLRELRAALRWLLCLCHKWAQSCATSVLCCSCWSRSRA